MAEENNQEEQKKSPVKLILTIVGGIVLLGVGLGIGMFIGGDESTDPSTEISQIIEKRNPEAKPEEDEETEEVAEECAEEEKDAEGNCLLDLKKSQKSHQNKKFLQLRIMNFLVIFTTNLKGSRSFYNYLLAFLLNMTSKL